MTSSIWQFDFSTLFDIIHNMKNILSTLIVTTTVILSGCATAKSTFTKDDFSGNKNRVILPESDAQYRRINIEYSAKKPFSISVKPTNNAFSGLSRVSFPASAANATFRDFKVEVPEYGDLTLVLHGAENCDIKKLTVEEISAEKYTAITTIPDPARKTNRRHLQIKANYLKAPKNPVILFGDSLTDNWRGARFDYMAKNFPIVNAGICGDKVEHLLWRILDMREMLTTNQPSVATFFIGTNNFSYQFNPADIALGVKNLLTTFSSFCPDSKIIVFAIPPRGFVTRPDALPFPKVTNPLIENAVNELNKTRDNDIAYFDFGNLLTTDNLMRKEYYENDKLHFSDKGYAEVITPFISGAIRLAASRNLPDDYFAKNAAWKRYLERRYENCKNNIALEEMLACEAHLKSLAPHWLKVFEKVASDSGYIPEMPHEYIRQSKEEGLPEELN